MPAADRRDQRSQWIAVGAAAVAGAAGAVALTAVVRRERPPALAPPRRVALIGDSYAVGLTPDLAKLLPDFRGEGHVGISTAGWMGCATCAAWLPDFRPDLVLVSLGANDGATPDPSSYQALVRALHGLGARVEWVEPPAALTTAAGARAVVASLGVPTVPATRTPLGPDGVHPQSYAPWAAEIARALS